MDIAITITVCVYPFGPFMILLAWIGSPPSIDDWIKNKLTRSK